MLFRIDASGGLGKVARTPQGGYQVPAVLTRTGVFEYLEGGQVVREYRPPDEVLASLATLTPATPVTYLHPVGGQDVNPSNFRQFAVGNLLEAARADETGHVHALLALQDAEVIAAVEAGTREVSCGYHCEIDPTPGVTPEGEKYDRVQRGIKYNHVAILPRGRAGSARLRLDSAGHALPPEITMKVFKLDGKEVSEQDLQTELARYEARRDAEAQALRAERDTFQGRADAAQSKVAELEAKVTELSDPKRVEQALQARLALVSTAQRVCGPDFRADGLSDEDIRLAVAKHAHPSLQLDGKSPAYVAPLFDAAVAAAAQDPDGLAQLAGRADGANPASTYQDPRAGMLAAHREAHKRPLAVAKA